ncbi:MAG TPA: hypothetical protein VG097_11310, partial [Gemmata sp.]|nr:hypothetical protein [Gemmata sp.]
MEDRTVPTIISGGGTIPLTFDDSANSADAIYTITASTVQLDNSTPVSYASSVGLVLKGGSGTDTFNVEATSDVSPVTLITGGGSSTVNVTPTSQDLANLAGFLAIQGNGGTTILNVDDQSDPAANVYTITASCITTFSAAPIVFAGIQGLTIKGESMPATYDVVSTGAGTPIALTGGNGNDTFNVGSKTNTLDPIQGAITISGGGDSDALNILDQGQTAAESYTLTPTSLTRAGIGPIDFGTLHAVAIDAAAGNAALTISGSAPTTPVTFNGGKGNNTV